MCHTANADAFIEPYDMIKVMACAHYTVHACCVQHDTTKTLACAQCICLCTLQCTCLQALCRQGQGAHPQLSHLANAVININIPAQDPFHGLYLAHQGSDIVDLNYQQVTNDTVD